MNKLRALALIFFWFAPTSILAQQPPPPVAESAPAVSEAHLDAARTLIDQLRLQELLDRSLEANLRAQVELNPRLGDYVDVLRAFLEKHVGWDAVKDDMLRIYTEAFSEEELRDLTAFYETPTGRKAVQVLPALMERGMSLGQKRVQENVGELQQALAKRQAELEEAEKPEEPQPPEKP